MTNGKKTKIRLINVLIKMQTMMILCLLDMMEVGGYEGDAWQIGIDVCCCR